MTVDVRVPERVREPVLDSDLDTDCVASTKYDGVAVGEELDVAVAVEESERDTEGTMDGLAPTTGQASGVGTRPGADDGVEKVDGVNPKSMPTARAATMSACVVMLHVSEYAPLSPAVRPSRTTQCLPALG